MAVSVDLRVLATAVADWADDAPGLERVYLFGSRVRGDNQPHSDVDVAIDLVNDVDPTNEFTRWWATQNKSDFEDLRRLLPQGLGPLLHINRDLEPVVALVLRAGRRVHTERKCMCISTRRKPEGAPEAQPFGPRRLT
jgi:predicted nucleotidyltransferase